MPPGKSPPLDAKLVSLLWAGPERAEEIAPLHAQLFDPPWTAASLEQTLSHPASTAFVAEIRVPARVTVGFILGQLAADEAEILTIGVAPELQRRGLGRRLIEGFARAAKRAEARKVHLEVASDNIGALALYKAMGFTETGRRKGYYERPNGKAEDAVTLALAL